ncbi:DUF748 domain-containing protein [Pseudobdellovibrio exovorus]|uniref:DUF748 domain-containing protein n=1 Tax=Pseudobdellovibrio exovorus JSS TaxID=1184267 RepID=M4V8V1_9BACT|nr:DUF748 domain-containing protein [Pseudobdellovibrio exovorus]AGH95643.1 hypothetical protein A11Q_1427 [Pseudobdellovibrio exovorus JSS]
MGNWLKGIQKKIVKMPLWILITLVVLFVIRMILPSICLFFINYTLENKLGTYKGHLDDFDLSLYRGAYQLQGLTIEKRESAVEPLLKVKEVDLSLAWRALLKKNISADVTIDGLVLRLADSSDEKAKQTGADEPKKNWEEVGGVLVPVAIETLKIHDSAIYFTNRDLKAPLPVSLEKIEIEAKDLRSRSEGKMSPLKASAILQKHADLKISGSLDLLANPLRFDLDGQIEKFKPNTVNSLLRLYIPVDVTEGELSAYSEVAAKDGVVWGYAKLIFNDGDIISLGQNYIGVKHFFVEIGTAFANWFLQNNDNKNMATIIPFVYENGNFNVDTSEILNSALRNRNEKIKPRIDDIISLEGQEPITDPKRILNPNQNLEDVLTSRAGVPSAGKETKENNKKKNDSKK